MHREQVLISDEHRERSGVIATLYRELATSPRPQPRPRPGQPGGTPTPGTSITMTSETMDENSAVLLTHMFGGSPW
jgi:hypothetical protein